MKRGGFNVKTEKMREGPKQADARRQRIERVEKRRWDLFPLALRLSLQSGEP